MLKGAIADAERRNSGCSNSRAFELGYHGLATAFELGVPVLMHRCFISAGVPVLLYRCW